MTKILDDDLIERLEAQRGQPGFAMATKQFGLIQDRRNRQREADASRAAQLDLLTPLERRREIIREVIENEGPAPQNLQYMHSTLAICGLPYKALPPGQFEFERKQGRMGIVVEAGKLRAPDGQRIQQPVPWGPKPRLILAYLSTEAIRAKSPTIDVARSFTAFMGELGFASRGGERGNIKPFKDQLQALAACRLEISTWDGKRSAVISTSPFDAIELWMDDDRERGLWPETMTFSDKFYKTLTERAMPIDGRALKAFSNSARRIDILFWLNYRLHTAHNRLTISWKALQDQFGGEGYARARRFRETFAEDLEHIASVFPKLPYKLTEEGFVLENADPTVLSIPPDARKSLKAAKSR